MIFETGLLEFLCKPLKLTGTPDVNQAYVFSHVFTPIVMMAFAGWCNLSFRIGFYLGIVIGHLIIKELIIDRVRHGAFNWPNVAERAYGLLLAGALIWI